MSGKSDNFVTEHLKQQTNISWLQQVADFMDPSYLFYDEPFSLGDWDKHQRWRRHCPKGLVCIRAAWGMNGPLIYLTLLTVAVGVYQEVFLESDWPRLSEDVPVSLIITATSFALALLMVFRTNSSYDRWWEARKQWGAIFTQCRIMARLTQTWLNQPEDKQIADTVLRWLQALPYLVLYHLSVESDEVQCLRDDVDPILKPEEVHWLTQQSHMPLAGQSAITHALSKSNLHCIQLVTIEAQLTGFAGSFGACERILRQPIPQAYTRHTSRFLMIWLTILPFALWPALHWACVLFCPIISFMLLGIENIGVQIEQPFHVLPLRQFCKVIRQNVLDIAYGIEGLKNPSILNTMEKPTSYAVTIQNEIDNNNLQKVITRESSSNSKTGGEHDMV